MSELIYDMVIKETIKEIIGEPGKLQPFAERVLNNHTQKMAVEVQLYVNSGGKIEDIAEQLVQQSKEGINALVEAFINSAELKDQLYKKTYEKMKEASTHKSWVELFSEIYEDESSLNEVFVRLIEEKEGIEITTAKQLQEVTRIREIYGYWDEEKEETVSYGDKEPTKEEAQEIAFKQLEDTFIKAMSYRYSTTLENMLRSGAKYKDLFEVTPKDFNLTDNWNGTLVSDQYSSILWAIEDVFLIGEPSNAVKPDLRAIANEIEAPYSVLMDVHKICNQWKA